MSKPNPTRPTATAADVERHLAELRPVQQKRLSDYGYKLADLRRICEVDGQADSVDALLAIVTDRPGYEHDQRDLGKAAKVAKTVGAAISPEAHLMTRKKYKPFYGGRNSTSPSAREMQKKGGVWSGPLGGVLISVGVIVVIAVLFVLFK